MRRRLLKHRIRSSTRPSTEDIAFLAYFFQKCNNAFFAFFAFFAPQHFEIDAHGSFETTQWSTSKLCSSIQL